jgi:membrane protein implicated in regulation of membrane protease activity
MNTIVSINQWAWLGLAAVLVTLEVLLGTNFFLLWMGFVAAIVGTVVWLIPTLTWEVQVLIFAVGSFACMVLWRQYLKHRPIISDNPTLNRRAEQYVGRTFTLTEPIVNGRGKIQVDDSTWRVEGLNLPEGTQVKVVGVDGVILKIKPIEAHPAK